MPRITRINESRKEIGRRVAAARRMMDFSQEEASQRIGVSRTTVASWETGKSMPSAEDMSKICKVLKVTADELVGLVPLGEATVEKFGENRIGDMSGFYAQPIGNQKKIAEIVACLVGEKMNEQKVNIILQAVRGIAEL